MHLSKIADYRPGKATLESKTHQYRRFLANEAIDGLTYYEPVARELIERATAAAPGGRLRLLLDMLELPGHRQVLMLALAYRRRALPILWQIRRGQGSISARGQSAFLDRLWDLLPEQAKPIIVADGAFSSVEVMKHLDGNGWGYRLRLSMETQVHLPEGRVQSLQELAPRPGKRRYLQQVYVTTLHAYGPISVAIYWREGEDKALPPTRRWPATTRSRATAGGCGWRNSSATSKAAVFSCIRVVSTSRSVCRGSCWRCVWLTYG